jgi:hypothetical protein
MGSSGKRLVGGEVGIVVCPVVFQPWGARVQARRPMLRVLYVPPRPGFPR